MKLSIAFIEEINRALSVGLLCLIILEIIWPGVVISVFNLNYWLIFWLGSVILLLFLQSENSKNERRNY